MKSSEYRIIAPFILSTTIGFLGIHRMLVGRWPSGLFMLICSMTFVGLIITAPLNLYDWIMLLAKKFKDGEGRPLTTW